MRKEVLMCMKYGHMIEIVYISAGDIITKRRVTLHEIKKDTFRAYCHLRHAYRIFYFDRILAVFQVNYATKEVETHE